MFWIYPVLVLMLMNGCAPQPAPRGPRGPVQPSPEPKDTQSTNRTNRKAADDGPGAVAIPPQADFPTKLAQALARSQTISHSYKTSKDKDGKLAVLKRLPGGEIYLKADLDIDADGSPRAPLIDPCKGCGQLPTSLSRATGWMGEGTYVNSERIPYFVLPLEFESTHSFPNLKLGDLAVIFKDGMMEFAILADRGPKTIIGEGSIFLAVSLGHNPWMDGIIKHGMSFGVEYIIFPGSSSGGIPSSVSEIRLRGRQLFDAFVKSRD